MCSGISVREGWQYVNCSYSGYIAGRLLPASTVGPLTPRLQIDPNTRQEYLEARTYSLCLNFAVIVSFLVITVLGIFLGMVTTITYLVLPVRKSRPRWVQGTGEVCQSGGEVDGVHTWCAV